MLEILDPIPDEVTRSISDGISRSNNASAVDRENFAVVHRLGDRLIAGVTASVSFSVLFINNLWVADDQRRAGMGRKLMFAAENEGRQRGARMACVDTLTSQAPAFYAKLGYEEFGRISGEANGQPLDRIWFRKTI